jgi:hypothetical protein
MRKQPRSCVGFRKDEPGRSLNCPSLGGYAAEFYFVGNLYDAPSGQKAGADLILCCVGTALWKRGQFLRRRVSYEVISGEA